MEYQNNARVILQKIISGATLTVGTEDSIPKAWLNKWVKGPPIEIPWNIADWLIKNEIVEDESGNWETKERHYVSNIRIKATLGFIEPS